MCFKMFIYHKSKVFHSNDTKMHSTWLMEVDKLSCPFPQQEPRAMGSCLPSVRGGHSRLWIVSLHRHHPYPPCGKRTSQSRGEGSNDGLWSSAEEMVLSGHGTTLSVIGRWCMLNPWLSGPSGRLLLTQTPSLSYNLPRVHQLCPCLRPTQCTVIKGIILMHSKTVI